MKTKCDNCNKDVGMLKHLKKINGNYFCKSCAREIRENHRRETIEKSGIKKELNQLKYKQQKESREKYKPIKDKNYIPKIKGHCSKSRIKNNCYLTLQEKQNLFRILLRRGIDGEDAKERISNLVKAQKEIKEKMLKQNKSEKEIKQKQQILLEELWNS